jgi:uncharacterized protein
VLPQILLVCLAFALSAIGTFGGIGGAILLVPLLALFGIGAQQAAPLGLATTAAASLAAAATQLDEGIVHQRLGTTVEAATTIGVVAGALASPAVPGRLVETVLALLAIGAAVVTLRPPRERGAWREVPDDTPVGECFGALAGVIERAGAKYEYRARRLSVGLPIMTVTGVIAGLSGIGAGFIKTPTMALVMNVPLPVAAATSTYTIGVTAAAGLTVFAAQGRLDPQTCAAVAAGALAGGYCGALLQGRIAPRILGIILSVTLLLIGSVLLVR